MELTKDDPTVAAPITAPSPSVAPAAAPDFSSATAAPVTAPVLLASAPKKDSRLTLAE